MKIVVKRTSLLLGTALALLATTPALSAQGTSTWVFFGSDKKLHYHTDSQGNRIMDFSFAGYKGGGVGLPVVPVAATVNPISGDNTAHLQAAIDSVSQIAPDSHGFRGAVLLAPGTYDVLGTLTVAASGVVLRGSGSGTGGTLFNMTGAPHLLLSIRGSGSPQTVGNSATITDSLLPAGSISFNVDSASGFAAGDSVLISRPVTTNWVHFMGMDTLVRNGLPQTWLASGSAITTDRTIASISGSQITLDAPLTDSFDGSLISPPGGSLIKYTFSGRISEVGVEHLSITAPAQDADISTPQYQALAMDAAIDGWVHDLVIHDTDNTITIGGDTKQITLDTITVSHSLNFTHSAGPADFSVSGTRNLASKCSVTGNTGVWPFVTQARVTGPIVLLNCSADQRGFAPHQRWATGLLADSCQFPGGTASTQGIAFSNRSTAGSGQGWDAGWAVAWNVSSPDFLVQAPAGSHNWCIGCIGSIVTKTDPNGDYDSRGTNVTPSSLYLEQLKERLGNAAIANIGYGTFGVAAAITSQTIKAGAAANYTVSVTPSGFFSESVALSIKGLPTGAKTTFSPASLLSGTSTLKVSTTTSTPLGTYTLTITGASGNLSHKATVTLKVT